MLFKINAALQRVNVNNQSQKQLRRYRKWQKYVCCVHFLLLSVFSDYKKNQTCHSVSQSFEENILQYDVISPAFFEFAINYWFSVTHQLAVINVAEPPNRTHKY